MDKYYIVLIYFYNYNICSIFYISGIKCVCICSFYNFGIYNKMGVKVFFVLVVKSLCEYVYIMLWSGEYFRVVVIMVIDVCYNGVKFDGLVFFCVCLIY